MKRRQVLASVLLALACLASCDTKKPASSTPLSGPRVVAMSPAVAAIMRDVGLGGTIVGRHAYDAWTDQSIPVCGEQVGKIDFEKLLSVKPTHVFIQMRETPRDLEEMATKRGFLVKNYSILSLEEIRSAARELWNWGQGPGTELPGVAGSATARAPIEDRMDAAWSRQTGVDAAKVGKVLLLAGVDPPSVPGPGSFHDDLLRRIGGTPAVAEGAPYIVMDKEDVLRLAPEAIILFLPRLPGAPAKPISTDEAMKLLGTLADLDIPCVRNAKVAVIDDPMAHLPGTGMIGVAEEMGRVLEKWSSEPGHR